MLLILLLAMWCLVLVGSYAKTSRNQAIKGSYERYKFKTILIATDVLILLLYTTASSVVITIEMKLTIGNIVMVAFSWVIVALLVVHDLYILLNDDDDDWFSKTGRKLKSFFRRASANLSAALKPPVPASSHN